MKLKEGYTQDDLLRLIREGVSAGLDAINKDNEISGGTDEESVTPSKTIEDVDLFDDKDEEEFDSTDLFEESSSTQDTDFKDDVLDLDDEEDDDESDFEIPKPSIKEKLSKIINFRKREDIPESGEFFDMTEDEKFKTVEQALNANVEAFTRQVELEDLAKDVSSVVGDRLSMYFNKGVSDASKKAAKDPSTKRHERDKSIFSSDTVNIGGKPVKYTRHVEVPKWNMDLLECITTDDKALNFEQIRRKITEEYINYFGGLDRIQTIYVQSYQLIINGVCYVPKLSKQVLLRLPFDCADYLLNGCVAPFFNWGYLYKMKRLHTLSFDDLDFVMTYVADDSGRGRDFKPMLMFKYIPNLSTLVIGQDVITYPFESEESAESVERVEREVRRSNHFTQACDNCFNKTVDVTKSLRQWGVSNLTNYAKNRGNKGFFMYAGGVTARAVGSLAFAMPEVVTRVSGGIVKGLARAYRETKEMSKRDN